MPFAFPVKGRVFLLSPDFNTATDVASHVTLHVYDNEDNLTRIKNALQAE